MKKGQLVFHKDFGRGIIEFQGRIFDYYKVRFKHYGIVEVYSSKELTLVQ